MTEAAKMHEKVLAKGKVILGDDHPNTLTSMHSLAEMYRQQGKMTGAAKIHEEVLAKRKMILGDDHPDTLTSMHNLAVTYRAQRKTGEVVRLELEKRRQILGDDHGQPCFDSTLSSLS
jgi:hypothetical protein